MTSGVGVIERPLGLVCKESSTPNGLLLEQILSRSPHVEALVYTESDAIFSAISAALESITNSCPDIHECELHSETEFVDRVAALARTEGALLIISDRHDLAQLVRERSCDGRAVVELLALANPPLRRIALVDRVVGRDASREALGEAIEGALQAIRYKLPPEKRSFTDSPAIEVHVVGNADELRDCLALRYAVYKLLGYLYEMPSGSQPGWSLITTIRRRCTSSPWPRGAQGTALQAPRD
jgi:hypothetical protein